MTRAMTMNEGNQKEKEKEKQKQKQKQHLPHDAHAEYSYSYSYTLAPTSTTKKKRDDHNHSKNDAAASTLSTFTSMPTSKPAQHHHHHHHYHGSKILSVATICLLTGSFVFQAVQFSGWTQTFIYNTRTDTEMDMDMEMERASFGSDGDGAGEIQNSTTSMQQQRQQQAESKSFNSVDTDNDKPSSIAAATNSIVVSSEDQSNNINDSITMSTTKQQQQHPPVVLEYDQQQSPSSSSSYYFCWPWSYNYDHWWTHHPDFEMDYQNDNQTHYCFRPIQNQDKAAVYRDLYQQQFHGNCSTMDVRQMWSSGWGADFLNVNTGLTQALTLRRPFQVSTQIPWHYAAGKDQEDMDNITKSACPTQDMFCYFLPLSSCDLSEQIQQDADDDKKGPSPPREYRVKRPDNQGNKYNVKRGQGVFYHWMYEYGSRPQTWLRKRIYDYKQTALNLTQPCSVMHVRRGDVVDHGEESRRYFSIAEYVEAAGTKLANNVLLLTDDANAIGEALYEFPSINWMYFHRKRYKANEGGWEHQTPSGDFIFEVVTLLTILDIVKQCDGMVFGSSNFALVMEQSLFSAKPSAWTAHVDKDLPAKSIVNEGNTTASKEYPLPSPAGSSSVLALLNNVSILDGATHAPSSNSCPPNAGGLLLVNLLGRLGNNFFEVSFANVLAKQLCWEVVYRPAWDPYFHHPNHHKRATQCFPNALLPEPAALKEEWTNSLGLNNTSWSYLTDHSGGQEQNEYVDAWIEEARGVKNLTNILSALHLKFDLSGDLMRQFVQQVGNPNLNVNETYFAGTSMPASTVPVRMIFMSAFMIQYDWMKDYFDDIHHWFAMDPSCCPSGAPSKNTVVIHIRNHEQGFGKYEVGMYKSIIEKYGYDQDNGYIIKIVCQPKDAQLPLVLDLLEAYPQTAVLEHGVDEYDALCIMKQAPVLIMNSGSTFSMMAALLSDPQLEQVVHYPINTLDYPLTTMKVPWWKYHLVNATSQDDVIEFDVDQSRMTAHMW